MKIQLNRDEINEAIIEFMAKKLNTAAKGLIENSIDEITFYDESVKDIDRQVEYVEAYCKELNHGTR